MPFLQLEFQTDKSDVLIAVLEEFPFNGFQETPSGFVAFIEKSEYTSKVEDQVSKLQPLHPFELKTSQLPDTNWNAVWESQFEKVRIDDFCEIRADFHKPSNDVKHEILINPKMAFGTGHHATTESVIRQMSALDFVDKRVFDYGCGTGILSIMAEKLGSKSIFANDIEVEAVENTQENIESNQCRKIEVALGDINSTKEVFDIILANINRNVLIHTMKGMNERLKTGGQLICSGVLERDLDKLRQSLEDNNFEIHNKTENQGWLCILALKLK